MAYNEPQITEIASFLSVRVPTEGASRTDAKEAWRKALRHARSNGTIGLLTRQLVRDAEGDSRVRAVCDDLSR